ncbi:adenylate/guanylate cyclase domain-containing protein [Marinimicrobium agarilyticum]|uniref:adenylate/guanylate cyclase domain-containing protein n=1 Tax=Marinimicrobium agarilyticum TaxID=306546 RepID=UPI000413ABF9|nr:adenylate/guanylate cyclase domain-containing protein [Marinimicrobium agarilyticum]
MNSINRTLAVMFADVSGSSALYKRLGNLLAKRSVDDTIAMMTQETQEYGGQVVKTLGDEIMARFDTAQAACQAAIAMQREARRDGVALRIGIAYGPALLDNDDIFGDTVNDAACVAHIARANQIVLTQRLARELAGELLERCQEFDRVAVKGDTRHSLIYRLQWESATQSHSATTVMSIEEIAGKMSGYQLSLTLGELTLTIHPEQTPYIIGRDPASSNLHIRSGLASRDHCHILFRRGKFVLVDHSTNGTYVSGPEQPEIYLRREEFPLLGEGTISIGQPAERAGEWLIHYRS